MRSGIHIRVCAQRYSGALPHLTRGFRDQVGFGSGFDIEKENVGLERIPNFVHRLSRTIEDNLAAGTPGSQDSKEFPAGNDFESSAPLRLAAE